MTGSAGGIGPMPRFGYQQGPSSAVSHSGESCRTAPRARNSSSLALAFKARYIRRIPQEGRTNLAVEQRGNPDFILIHRLGYMLERQSLHFITPTMSSVVPFFRGSYEHIPCFALALKSSLSASGVERLVKASPEGMD